MEGFNLERQDKSIKCVQSRCTVVKVRMKRSQCDSQWSHTTTLPTRQHTTYLQNNAYPNETPGHRHAFEIIITPSWRVPTELAENFWLSLKWSIPTSLTIFWQRRSRSRQGESDRCVVRASYAVLETIKKVSSAQCHRRRSVKSSRKTHCGRSAQIIQVQRIWETMSDNINHALSRNLISNHNLLAKKSCSYPNFFIYDHGKQSRIDGVV